MSSDKKRTYNSAKRYAHAAQTEARILTSAKKLFPLEGVENITIEKLAQDAGVSVPTIYALFKSKRGIIRALIDEVLPHSQREALVEEFKQEKSATARLAISAKIARQMYDAERAQLESFWGASILTPEFKELEKEREQRRYKRQEEGIKMLGKENALLKGLSISRAQDILWAFTGRDMYRLFVVEQGWTSEEYEKWLAQLLVKTLLKADE